MVVGCRYMLTGHLVRMKVRGSVFVRGIFLSRRGPIFVKNVLKWLAINCVSSVLLPFMALEVGF